MSQQTNEDFMNWGVGEGIQILLAQVVAFTVCVFPSAAGFHFILVN